MAKSATAETVSESAEDKTRRSLFQYIREVITELKKVTTPTRKELNWLLLRRAFLCCFYASVNFGSGLGVRSGRLLGLR